MKCRLNVGWRNQNYELMYADDTALFSTTPEGLNNHVQAVNQQSATYKHANNASKIKIMVLDDKWQENTNIVIDNIHVERVQSFQYLGAMFTTFVDGASNIKTAVGDDSTRAT